MKNRFILIVSAFLIISKNNAELCTNDAGDEGSFGACFLTSHTFTHPIETNETTFKDVGDIKEYHFHTYWFQHRPESYAAALRIQAELLSAVAEGKFIVVLPGITEEILPGIDESQIPQINTEPVGPHPCGSFETWVPQEYLSEAMSFFYAKKGRTFDF